MVQAYILLNVEPGAESKVLDRFKSLDIVCEAYVSYGVYDIIIRLKADTMDELKDAVSHKIRTTDQVRSTVTLIIIEQ
ncbi:MAG: Lrp/AsnC ligand binding domain-containing protein [Candidatus Bathyarchaeia archaeon]|jgi:DNA-binding Lrp family transcriptional regulator